MDPPKKPFHPLPIPPSLLSSARALRKNMTDAEQFLWYILRRKQLGGYRFRRQHPFGAFVVDFYCCEAHLGIELDGGQHTDAVPYDSRRTAFLEGHGVQVLRVWNDEVFQNLEGVLQVIYEALLERTGVKRQSGE